MARDLLLEIGTEDLPARYVDALAMQLATIYSELDKARVGYVRNSVRRFATPRRIAVLVSGVDERQQDQVVERIGPALATALKDGQPTQAALGFARSCGVEFSALGQKDGKLHHSKVEPGKSTVDLLPSIFEALLRKMDEQVPKRMRWGSGEETFVRPVQWLTCLFGHEVVPLQRFSLIAGRITYGHRFHAPAAITLEQPSAYEAALRKAMVWADVESRRAEIRRQIEAEAVRIGGHARITEGLLDEVTALVEWPAAITGRFEERFLALPPEVIVATVETNQRYFTVFKDVAQTQLTNAFVTISNIQSHDVAQVIAGNERVVRPRLTDALFFWEQDLKQPLEAYGAKLASMTFQKELGSLGDKVGRVRRLAAGIAAALAVDAALTERAAALCKNDLVTRMVYEFPELQGLMGGYYAQRSGEQDTVAAAIREHYLPTQQGTPIPATAIGRIVALADKLDTLAGIFAIGQKPSASKDPFALRRAALGVLRIIREAGLKLHWFNLVVDAVALQPVDQPRQLAAQAHLRDFIWERYRYLCIGSPLAPGGTAVTAEQFEAVQSVKEALLSTVLHSGEGESQLQASAAATPDDIGDFEQRLAAVQVFSALPAAATLAIANKRIRNILRQAGGAGGDVDAARFQHDAERALFAKLAEIETLNAKTVDYRTQLVNLAALREPVDAFFDQVMVNVDDAGVRANRLALLARLDRLCRSVADLSQLPG